MSGTLIASTIKDGASATNNLALDSSGNVTVGNNLTVSGTGNTSFSGNVGIGTSSPTSKLDVQAGSNATARVKTTSSGYALFDIDAFTGNQPILRFLANGTESARILSPVNEAPNQLVFTTGTGSTERMRIDASGNLLVGVTSSVNGGSAFTSAGTVMSAITAATTNTNMIVFRNGNGNVGSITTNGSATAFNTSSDYRLKHDVQPMQNALTTIGALKPVTYKWNADNSEGEGFIAHELQAVIPHAVTGEKDAVDDEGNIKAQGVDYSKIVVHLVAALQEAVTKITALEDRITKLESGI